MATWLFNCTGSQGVCNQHDERIYYPSHPCWGYFPTNTYHFWKRLLVTNVVCNVVTGSNGPTGYPVIVELSDDGTNWVNIGSFTTGNSYNYWPFTVNLAYPMWAKHLRFRQATGHFIDGSNGTVTYSSSQPTTPILDAIIDYAAPVRASASETLSFSGHTSVPDTCPVTTYAWRRNGVLLSTALSFSVLASTFPLGTSTVTFQATRDSVVSNLASVNILVGRYPPVAIVDDWPGAGPFIQGTGLYFNGHGVSELNITGYFWLSDVDGIFSAEKSCTVGTLSLGTHNITFYVADERGVLGSVYVGMLEQVPPTPIWAVSEGEYNRAFDTFPSYVRIGTFDNGRTRRGACGV